MIETDVHIKELRGNVFLVEGRGDSGVSYASIAYSEEIKLKETEKGIYVIDNIPGIEWRKYNISVSPSQEKFEYKGNLREAKRAAKEFLEKIVEEMLHKAADDLLSWDYA